MTMLKNAPSRRVLTVISRTFRCGGMYGVSPERLPVILLMPPPSLLSRRPVPSAVPGFLNCYPVSSLRAALFIDSEIRLRERSTFITVTVTRWCTLTTSAGSLTNWSAN